MLFFLHFNLLVFVWGHFVLMEFGCLIFCHILLQTGIDSSKYVIYKHVAVLTEYLVLNFDCSGSYLWRNYMNFTFWGIFDVEEVHQKRLIVKTSHEWAQIVSLSICEDDNQLFCLWLTGLSKERWFELIW